MTVHYLEEADRLARRLAIVDQGRIVAEGARAALAANGDWSIVFSRMGYLVIFTVVCTWLATRAFRVYQRSI